MLAFLPLRIIHTTIQQNFNESCRRSGAGESVSGKLFKSFVCAIFSKRCREIPVLKMLLAITSTSYLDIARLRLLNMILLVSSYFKTNYKNSSSETFFQLFLYF